MYRTQIFSILLTISHYALLVQCQQRICPIRQCRSCLNPALQSAPGIGFHLGLTSGTAAVSFGNGHVESVVHIPGSSEYIALMQYMTTSPNRFERPPIDTRVQRWNYAKNELKRRFKRRLNLLLGGPGTPEAGILSALIASLHSAVERHLAIPCTIAGIAMPSNALLSGEEVHDALIYAGLKEPGEYNYPDGELNTAYGALGLGLCTSYTEPYMCEKEEAAFSDGDMVLQLDYTNKTLAAATDYILTARSTLPSRHFSDWDLGYDHAADGTDKNSYWNAVRLRIQEFAAASRRPLSQLILTGEQANNPMFLKTVKDALGDTKIMTQLKGDNQKLDFTFLVSQGVAELQRRRQQGWLRCMQPKHCKKPAILTKTASKVRKLLEL